MVGGGGIKKCLTFAAGNKKKGTLDILFVHPAT